MEGDLFVRLMKYRIRKERDSKENFFTEILAFILRNDEELLSGFLKLLDKEKNWLPTHIKNDFKKFKIETQVEHEGKRPDIEIIINQVSIFIENKIESSVRKKRGVNKNLNKKELDELKNQLDEYLKFQKERENKNIRGYVTLLTKYLEIIDTKTKDKLLSHIYWEDIYQLFKKHEKKLKELKTKNEIMFFLKLMEDENMEPYSGITKKMVNNYGKFLDNIQKLFEKVALGLENIGITNKHSSVSNWYINKSFRFKKIKFELVFDRDEAKFQFYLNSKKKKEDLLDEKQKKKIKKLGFKEYEKRNYHFIKTYDKNEEFFDCDIPEKQLETLKGWYVENFKKVKEILES